MKDFVFDEPVVIDLGERGRLRRVVMATQAADCLLHRWPTKGGKRHLAARHALMEALQGLRQARDARLAFADAAKEAKILVLACCRFRGHRDKAFNGTGELAC